MKSGPVKFEQILSQVKIETGFKNLRPLYNSIRDLIFWGTKDIGYGDTIIQKTHYYQKGNENFDGKKLKLPEDMIEIDKVGCCKELMFEGCDYNYQGKYLFLCEDKDDIQIEYSTYVCDGRGNPVVSYNHFKAVVAYIVWKLYSKRLFLGTGNGSTFSYYEQTFERLAAAAVGNDAMPATPEDWIELGSINRMSSFDALVHLQNGKCCGCAPKTKFLKPEAMEDKNIYWWQFDDLSKTIEIAPQLDQSFFDLQNTETMTDMLNGKVLSYISVGRVGFAIPDVEVGEISIKDIFGDTINENVFDNYYDFENKIDIYISKEHYTHSSIFYQFQN